MNDPLKILSFKQLPSPVHQAASALNATITEVEPIRITADFDEQLIGEALATSEAFLFTSYQALAAIRHRLNREQLEGKKIYCVGSRTAGFFRNWEVDLTEEVDAASLGSRIARSGISGFTYFHGDRSLTTIDDLLTGTGKELKHVEVYKNSLLYPKIEALENYQILWYFSPSGVESFLKHNRFPEHATIGAIGPTTAASINSKNLQIASKPDVLILLRESINHYQTYVRNQK